MPWSRIARRARQIFFFLLPILIVTAEVWAQKKPGEEEPQESYVLSYALLILCAALGLLPICRPSRRDKRAKAPQ